MASTEIIIFDAAASKIDGTDPGSPLTVGWGTNYRLFEHEYPAAPQDVMYASSVDTTGESPVSRRYSNREIRLKFKLIDPTGSLRTTLQAKFAKYQAEGGTLKRTMADGAVRTYDIVSGAGWNPSYDFAYYTANLTIVEMVLPAAPRSRGAEVDMGDNTETTLSALVFSEASLAGDADGLGRLVIDNDASAPNDWWGAITALESSAAYDITASSAALMYQAEALTALGGSSTAAGPSGASGSGSNVMRNTALAGSDVAILSTQATGGGAHLTHIGVFEVLARVQVPTTNTGLVTVALEWGAGDFTVSSRGAEVTIPAALAGTWALVDLGQVIIPPGSVRWEGRLTARSTVVGDDVDVDVMYIVPASPHSGVTESVLTIPSPSTWAARDEFDQAAATPASGMAAPVGGSWASTGDAGDFQIGGVATLIRGATTDSGVAGRLATLGSALTTTAVQCDVNINATGCEAGILLRYVDASNFAAVFLDTNGQAVNYRLVVAGAVVASGELSYPFTYATTHTLTAYSDPIGNLYVWANAQGARRSQVPSIVARLSQLATGGTLASGKVGLHDFCNTGSSVRAYDNFKAWAPALDAGVYAGQSLEINSTGVRRENAAGTIWSKPAKFEGNYLLVPPSGAEARTVRAFVKPLYQFEQAVGVRADDRIDDISARLFVTPCYLT